MGKITQDSFIIGTCAFLFACLILVTAVSTASTDKSKNELERKVLSMKNTLLPKTPLPTIDTLAVFEILGTHYHPVVSQCDADPLVTADNSTISLNKLKKKTIKWVALSRDLLTRWGGPFNYGDTLYVHHVDPNIKGTWIVHDSMNFRFRKRVDFLTHIDNFFPHYTKGILISNKPFYNKR